MSKYRPFLVIAIVLVVALGAGYFLLRARRTQQTIDGAENTTSISQATTSPERKIPPDVVVTLEEFGDYQCPPCGLMHPTLKKLKQELGPNLNFVFRNLPLTSVHKNAMVAAQAAEAARMQNKFWEMHDLLYENQDLWKDDINPKTIFIKFAADLGLDTGRFVKDMESEQLQLRIQADVDAAAQLGLQGTPSILINGRQLRPEATNPEGVRKGVEVMLSRGQS
jgi:formate-nitrite transporter family protein